MNDDLFEEFEFKPLTEGLGFHKKAEQIKTDKESSRLAHDKVARTIPSAPPATPTNAGTTFTGTLNAATANKAPTPASDSISKIMSTLPPSFGSPGLDFLEEAPAKKPNLAAPISASSAQPPAAPTYKNAEFQTRLEESFAKAFPKSAVRSRNEAVTENDGEPKGLFSRSIAKAKIAAPAPKTAHPRAATAANFSAAGTPAVAAPTQNIYAASEASNETLFTRAASIPSAIVDGLAVLGISVLCLVIILTMTKADLVGMLSNAQTDGAAQWHLAILYVVMLQLYMLVCRSFVGATLGEWSFDTHLGTPDDQQQAAYPLKVVARTVLITATGFILPIVSHFIKRDVLAPVVGVALYSHEQDPS